MRKRIVYSIISILIILIGLLFVSINNNKQKNENLSMDDIYINNNPYNKNLSEYSKDKDTEKAEYNKYITDEANEKLINQLVYVEIKQTKKVDEIDKSTSTDTIIERTFILEDYNNNSWIFIKEGATWISDNQNDLIVYGKYLGVIEYNGVKYPQIDVQFVSKNIDKLDTEKYKNIADEYINSLQNKYSKEKFTFKEFKIDTTNNEIISQNDNEKVQLEIIINNNKIHRVNVDFIKANKNIEDVDQDFLKFVITNFDSSITESKAIELIKDAVNNLKEFKKHAYDKGYQYKKTVYNNIILEEGITEKTLEVYYEE